MGIITAATKHDLRIVGRFSEQASSGQWREVLAGQAQTQEAQVSTLENAHTTAHSSRNHGQPAYHHALLHQTGGAARSHTRKKHQY